MELFFQQVTNGLAVGGIYALVALGYTMVYGVLKLINFAHGDLFTAGAYLGLTLVTTFTVLGRASGFVGVAALIVLVMLLVAFLGVVLERTAYKPLRKSPRLSVVVSALGASIFLENAMMLIYGARFLVFPQDLLPSVPDSHFRGVHSAAAHRHLRSVAGDDAGAVFVHPKDPDRHGDPGGGD